MLVFDDPEFWWPTIVGTERGTKEKKQLRFLFGVLITFLNFASKARILTSNIVEFNNIIT